jgi:hypothetical protein
MRMSAILSSTLVLMIAVTVLYTRVEPILVSPVYGLIFAYLFIFISGVVVYNPNYTDLDMSPAEAMQVLSQIFLIVSAFIVGACVVLFRKGNRQILQRTTKDLTGFQLSKEQIKWGFALPVVCFALTITSYGLSNLWYSPEYLPPQNVILGTLASVAAIATALVLGVIAGQNSKKATRAALLLQVILLVLMAAESTRKFAALPVLFCFGTLIARPASRGWRAVLFATCLLTPFTIMIPITTRAMDGIGLSTFTQIPSAIAQNDIGSEVHTLLNNVLMGPAVTAESERPISSNKFAYVLTSVNPAPGIWTSWYEDMERINLTTPFNAMGDLLRAGTWVALLYYAFVGAYFARVELRLRSGSQVGPEALVLIGLSFAFIIMSTEYPLRMVTRYLYYMIGVEVIAGLFLRLNRRARLANNITQVSAT